VFNIVEKTFEIGGKTVTLQTGKIARQADGAVMLTVGKTMILCTTTIDKKVKEDIDFLPLTVVYQEKAFAAGKIPGGFFKRETKPSEGEVLTSRVIDRSIRPLFPDNYHYDTQVVCTLLSHDPEVDPEIFALIGAAASVQISGAPFKGPIAASKVGYVNGEFLLNPNFDEILESQLDLIVSGTHDSVLMVESEASELSEATMLKAVKFAHDSFQVAISAINDLAKTVNKPLLQLPAEHDPELVTLLKNYCKERVISAFLEKAKQKRREMLDTLKTDTIEHFEPQGYDSALVAKLLKKLESEIVREWIVSDNRRIDGRRTDEIRQLEIETGILPMAHGSSLFTRGETQAIVATTLGTTQDEQILDGINPNETRAKFMLHYNFPSFSVGEVGPMRAPGRREIGHGKLAWRAVKPVMPEKAAFPYTVRVVSEITESNGSSSMATVCGASLALMDAGVPIAAPVAGIAMGLIMQDSKNYVILSDIMGDEDHLGDMDFKVAGTDRGITALQMDIKVCGITLEIMERAIAQAQKGRAHILYAMNNVLNTHRTSLSENAPTITKITVPKDKVRDIIGSGGKVIKEIVELSGAKIDIDDSGEVSIAVNNAKGRDIALTMIKSIISDLEVGSIYQGKVAKIVDFGAFITIGGKDALVHISEIVKGRRLDKVTEVLSEGQSVWVKVVGFDKGKFKLSMKAVDQETGQEIIEMA